MRRGVPSTSNQLRRSRERLVERDNVVRLFAGNRQRVVERNSLFVFPALRHQVWTSVINEDPGVVRVA